MVVFLLFCRLYLQFQALWLFLSVIFSCFQQIWLGFYVFFVNNFFKKLIILFRANFMKICGLITCYKYLLWISNLFSIFFISFWNWLYFCLNFISCSKLTRPSSNYFSSFTGWVAKNDLKLNFSLAVGFSLGFR